MRLGFGLAYTILFVAVIVSWIHRPLAPPEIQGVLLAKAQPIPGFELVDHRGQGFSNRHLLGRWHLVSYGFTSCPDICPTTLNQLVQMKSELDEEDKPQVLFYTVDHRRDTPEQLASYLPYFDPEFIGLTHTDTPENTHLPFEHGLGIAASLDLVFHEDGSLDHQNYRVNHGVGLLLINPDGKLQAILQPREIAPGVISFDPEELLRDYKAIRAYSG